MNNNEKIIYDESLSSSRTTVLFVFLTLIFLLLLLWRMFTTGLDFLAIIFFLFSGIFLFYSFNYRKLTIQLTPDSLKLTFGIFHWTVPMDNVESCKLDDPPMVKKYGGAGIHFMFVDGRYRASFNFLEYLRVVVALKKKGKVQDISFTTRRPDEILNLIQKAVAAQNLNEQ